MGTGRGLETGGWGRGEVWGGGGGWKGEKGGRGRGNEALSLQSIPQHPSFLSLLPPSLPFPRPHHLHLRPPPTLPFLEFFHSSPRPPLSGEHPSLERVRSCEGVAEDDIVLRMLLSPTPLMLTPSSHPRPSSPTPSCSPPLAHPRHARPVSGESAVLPLSGENPSVERVRSCEGVAEDDIVLRKLLSPTPLKLTPKTLPANLVLSFALGLSAANLSALATSFRKFASGAAAHAINLYHQAHNAFLEPLDLSHPPFPGKWAAAHATNLRYRAFHLFLRSLDFEGTVILADPTDVLFLANPFPTLNDMSFHLYTGSTTYPTHGIRFLPPEHKRLAACYGTRLAFSLANSRIITSGIVAGTMSQVPEFLIQVIEDFERLPDDCIALEGSDEAVVNHLVRSGKQHCSSYLKH
ncbi:unnamed protein product [Closterium sp. Naga37s-1]|nr:unnamed protein product [Closterium sp. Naga37s-1]